MKIVCHLMAVVALATLASNVSALTNKEAVQNTDSAR